MFLNQRDAFTYGFFGVIKGFFADVRATLHAHDASGKRDVFQPSFVLPFLHFWIRTQRGVNRLGQRKKFHAAVHPFGIFTEHDLIDWNVFFARVRDFVAAIIQRVARDTFAWSDDGVEV